MRIAALSDIHGNLPALEAVLADVAAHDVDITVNLGDILSGPLWPAETAKFLQGLGWPTIRGNHERQILGGLERRMGAPDRYAAAAIDDRDRIWLRSLPATLDLGHGVWCCHGTPSSDLTYLIETPVPGHGVHGSAGIRLATGDELRERLGAIGAPVVLCGHSHMPRVVRSGATLVVNPGSVGLQAFDDDHVHRHDMETGSPHARWALLTLGDAGWSVTLRAVAYDWAHTARQAERRGAFDWADALLTGRVGRIGIDWA